MRGRQIFLRYKYLLEIFSKFLAVLPIKLRILLFYGIRNMQGLIGIALRYCFIKSIAKACGDNVSVHPGVFLLNPINLEIGNHVSIHPMCYIDSIGGISIGDNVSIAHNVTILSSTHRYEKQGIPIKDQGVELKRTIIEDNIWIGAKTTILAGTLIHSKSIIGANSLVTKKVESNLIMGGVPAKKIKDLSNV